MTAAQGDPDPGPRDRNPGHGAPTRRRIVAAVALGLAGAAVVVGLATLRRSASRGPSGEHCLDCHGQVGGLGESHGRIGCVACHLGAPSVGGAEAAHGGMILVPGNLQRIYETCGRGECHGPIAARVQGSLMATARGMIAVNRFAFGEQSAPHGTATVGELGTSPADSHLRQLCVGCHLGTVKARPAPIGEISRGGGCLACHLNDDPPRTSVKTDPAAFQHPGLSIQIDDRACFGCHSRSGRLSLAYAGWSEIAAAGDSPMGPGRRRLDDGRLVGRQSDDLHHRAGLSCIDCHTAAETMGDGQPYGHEEEATRIRCTTCHRLTPAKSVSRERLDGDSAAIVRLRPHEGGARRYLLEDRSGEALVNATPLENGEIELRRKADGVRLRARPPSAECRGIHGHERVSCQSCHSLWAPRCVGCHTQLEPPGIGPGAPRRWIEYDVAPTVAPPTLGLFTREGATTIEPAIPGMVMTLNGPEVTVPSPLPGSAAPLITPGRTRFVRAYAYTAPHTTLRRGRSCVSCHLDPAALGYGAGVLRLVEIRGEVKWRFEPTYAASPFDGLPGDAWIGFLDDGAGALSTRGSFRPLTLEIQRRVLGVGACLTCHDPEGPAGRRIFAPAFTSGRGCPGAPGR